LGVPEKWILRRKRLARLQERKSRRIAYIIAGPRRFPIYLNDETMPWVRP